MAPERSPALAQSELRTRILSALALAPVALAAVAIGGPSFAALVALVAAIAWWEWAAISSPAAPMWTRLAGAAFLVAGLMALAFHFPAWAFGLLAAPALLGLALGLRDPSNAWMGMGFVYVGVPCAGFIVLRQAEPSGWAAILFVLVVVWATDVAAYFGGRAFGGPKLWPRVSPKKTWSGALSGLVAAVAAGGLTLGLARMGQFGVGALLALPLSIAAQAGDLLESAVKRRFGVKDSGHIIPGHGGVLDRVDGILGAAALAWLIAGLGLGGEILILPADVAAVGGGGT